MLLELTVIDFAGESQHSGLVAFHSHVHNRTGVSGRRTVVFGVDFQQEPFVSVVEVQRFSEHNCRGTVRFHYQRKFGLRLRSGYQVTHFRIRRGRFIRVQRSYSSYDGRSCQSISQSFPSIKRTRIRLQGFSHDLKYQNFYKKKKYIYYRLTWTRISKSHKARW